MSLLRVPMYDYKIKNVLIIMHSELFINKNNKKT